MERYELQKLRELPIEGVAERLGLSVSRHKCLCPFHNDHHASLSFKVSKNTYRCFVCGASGGPIDLVMHYLNLGFLEACKWLADVAGVVMTIRPPLTSFPSKARLPVAFPAQEGKVLPLSRGSERGSEQPQAFDPSRYERFFERPWLNDEARRFLFEERRLDPRVVRWCRLTSWKDKQGVPWLQTPYYDREGKLVGIQNRNLIKGALPRFRFPQGSRCTIYNLPVLNLLRPGDELYITEGCSDCWAMLSAGHKAIAIPSATLLTKKDIEILTMLNGPLDRRTPATIGSQECLITFHMYPDRDEPGERLFLQLKQVLPSLEHHQLPLGCKDFGEYYIKHET